VNWRISAGANAAEERPVAGTLTFSGMRVRACEAVYDDSGHGSSQWSARVRGSLRASC